MTRLALTATILILASGCDKAKGIGGMGGSADAAEPPAGERFDLASRPDVVFQIFGERDDPRMIPIAALVNGNLRPISLGAEGWREFDSLYTRSGREVAVFHGGRKVGTAKVRQGMWEKANAPLSSLPGCRLLTPLAAVSLAAPNEGYTVEYLASTAQLSAAPEGRPMAKEAAARTARALGHAVGKEEGLGAARLDSLDFYGTSIVTGASSEPTVIASFIDPGAQGASGDAKTAHVFVIADRRGADYSPTFSHAVNGAANDAEYRRYVDHLDFTGDGVSEIVLEAWQYGGDTQLLVLGWRNGRWEEVYRGRPSWCLDARR